MGRVERKSVDLDDTPWLALQAGRAETQTGCAAVFSVWYLNSSSFVLRPLEVSFRHSGS